MEVNDTVLISAQREGTEKFADMHFSSGKVTRVYKNGSLRVSSADQRTKYLFKTNTLLVNGWLYTLMTKKEVRIYALAALYAKMDYHPTVLPCGAPYTDVSVFRTHTIIHHATQKPLGEWVYYELDFYNVTRQGWKVMTYMLIAIKPLDETTYRVVDSFYPDAQDVTAPNIEMAAARYLAQYPY